MKQSGVKMKRSFVLLSFVLVTTLVFAQSNYQDVIYSKKKETYWVRGNNSSTKTTVGLQSGYKGIVELGYLVGVGDYGMDRLKLDIINGYQINPYFSLGIGIGLRYYFDREKVLMPLFADFRVNFINKNVSPYLSLGLGYSFDATNGFEGFESVGFLLNPTVGVSFKISDKSSVNVGLGYEMQIMKSSSAHYYNMGPNQGYQGYYRYYTFTEHSGTINVIIGISF